MEKDDLQNELKSLGLEVLEISTDTMLEEFGASRGGNGCCSVIIAT
ncbi:MULTISPECIES: thiopeptide-type bacteriocin [unclassified Streptococcus]|nr:MULTISPECIES: thiopeptide-type bacteriocin [unclassified Streptococcus]MBF0787073.1 hypothetical protein [Streptococcus sp. 19428wC2_LYSM12]MCQ9211369.1 hypothetical protein [Streptococcus sp. B01]MCQ9214681.1 hypothetical protein [Streptococcus sp. O1]